MHTGPCLTRRSVRDRPSGHLLEERDGALAHRERRHDRERDGRRSPFVALAMLAATTGEPAADRGGYT